MKFWIGLAVFIAGLSLGLILRLPLLDGWGPFDWIRNQFIEGSAEVFGAFLGAAISVAFAAILDERKANARERDLHRMLSNALKKTEIGIEALPGSKKFGSSKKFDLAIQCIENAKSVALRVVDAGVITFATEQTTQRLTELISIANDKHKAALNSPKNSESLFSETAQALAEELQSLRVQIEARDMLFAPIKRRWYEGWMKRNKTEKNAS